MTSEIAFTIVVALAALQRGAEIRRGRANVGPLLARGGEEHGERETAWLRMLHAGWIASMLIEVYYIGRPFLWRLALASAILVLVGQGLRLASRLALGDRWTVRIVTVRGEPPVTHDVYRWLRHPSYAGLALEVVAFPLLHTAWLTAVVFAVLYAILLLRMIRIEEVALARSGGYRAAADDRPPLGPRARIP